MLPLRPCSSDTRVQPLLLILPHLSLFHIRGEGYTLAFLFYSRVVFIAVEVALKLRDKGTYSEDCFLQGRSYLVAIDVELHSLRVDLRLLDESRRLEEVLEDVPGRKDEFYLQVTDSIGLELLSDVELYLIQLRVIGVDFSPKTIPFLLDRIHLFLLLDLHEVPQIFIKLLNTSNYRVELPLHPHHIFVIRPRNAIALLQYPGYLGREASQVLPDLLGGVLDGYDPVFAVLHGVVHAAGAQNLPADGAIDGIDDIMLQTSLKFIRFHELLSKLDWLTDRLLELTTKDLHPFDIFLLFFLALPSRFGGLPTLSKPSIHLTILSVFLSIIMLNMKAEGGGTEVGGDRIG